MSSEVQPTRVSGDAAGLARRAAALRLAFGTAACFVVAEAANWDATFLAPLLAANMLIKLPGPPTLREGLGLVILIAVSTGLVLGLVKALNGHPAVMIIALVLLLYLSFYFHRRGAPGLVTLLLQISAVTLPTIAVVSPDGAAGFAAALLSAGTVAVITVWFAFAIFPTPLAAFSVTAAPGAVRPLDPAAASRHALLDTVILLPLLVWYILDATQVAVVVLIVIVTVLREQNPQGTQRAALGLILGNLIGGMAAALVYNLIILSHSFVFLIAACLAANLLFAGRLATAGDQTPLYAIAFATFILLLGLGLTPLPGGSGEAFASRLANVVLASVYAVGCIAVTSSWKSNARLSNVSFDQKG
jgi:hypothetical protein